MTRHGRTVLRQVEIIDANVEVARDLLLDPSRWAPLLPHIELANIHYKDDERRIVRFRALRLWWWPVWLLVEIRDDDHQVIIKHLAGAGKGVTEYWRFAQLAGDQAKLELNLAASDMSGRARSWLIVAPLAVRTFQMIAMLAEAEAMVDRSMQVRDSSEGLPKDSISG